MKNMQYENVRINLKMDYFDYSNLNVFQKQKFSSI